MRKFLDEAGSSNDEEEQHGQREEEEANKLLDTEQDQSLVNIEAKIEKLRDLEAAEEKRLVIKNAKIHFEQYTPNIGH